MKPPSKQSTPTTNTLVNIVDQYVTESITMSDLFLNQFALVSILVLVLLTAQAFHSWSRRINEAAGSGINLFFRNNPSVRWLGLPEPPSA